MVHHITKRTNPVVVFLFAFQFVMGIVGGCRNNNNPGDDKAMPSRDINAVKEAHVEELMSVPGVVGVYVGELSDHSPCIGVMVAKRTAELERRIPKVLEGYPVRMDETGNIKPMK